MNEKNNEPENNNRYEGVIRIKKKYLSSLGNTINFGLKHGVEN